MRRLVPVALFAIATAYVEAAIVVYLRRLTGVVEPSDPSIFDAAIAAMRIGTIS